jgi:hypothetical protein
MTAQVIIGLVFVLIGVAIELAKAAGLLGAGEIGYVGEVSNLGFLLLGKELLDKSPAAQARSAARKSVAPIACAFLLLGGCATLRDIKPIARDVNNIARELCEATMGVEAERQGLPIRELCAISYVIAPFLEAQHLASANAKLGRELTVHECVP